MSKYYHIFSFALNFDCKNLVFTASWSSSWYDSLSNFNTYIDIGDEYRDNVLTNKLKL